MASFNRVVLVGNLTRDPELRTTAGGMSVLDAGLAVNDRRKDPNGNGWIEETSFVDCTVWGRSAEVLNEYTKKGSQILVEGRLKQDTWEQDGQKRSKLKVIAERVVLLGSRGDGGGNSGGGYGGGYQQQSYQRSPQQSRPASNAPRQQGGGNGGDYYNDFSQNDGGGDDIPF